MPGSGGMGGRSKSELGYLAGGGPGEKEAAMRVKQEQAENNEADGNGSGGFKQKGGNWKISEELWGMIEERMGDERRKRGQLSFDRFSADIAAGRGGEKRKYDRVRLPIPAYKRANHHSLYSSCPCLEASGADRSISSG